MKKIINNLLVTFLMFLPLRHAESQEAKTEKPATNIANSTKNLPFLNSLGMKFVPVPKTNVLFSIWDTRVCDYRAFAKETPTLHAKWTHPGFEQTNTDPVVWVSWLDAKAFCAWLTNKEQKEGKIPKNWEYRLPTDAEWSIAVGRGKYPWGNQWPPPNGAGNYYTDLKVDNYAYTSPVGSFPANEYGLYDMGGNVWQWCEDIYQPKMNEPAVLEHYPSLKTIDPGDWYVVRGASFNLDDSWQMLSSFRLCDGSGGRLWDLGFRCVLAPKKAR